MTRRGWAYVRDACARYTDVHEVLSTYAEEWESGTMSHAERRDGQVRLVLLAWEQDSRGAAEAMTDLRARGFDAVDLLPPSCKPWHAPT